MISRNTLILLGVLVVLVGVVFFIPWYQGRNPNPSPTPSTPLPKQVFPTGQISQLTMNSKDGKTVILKASGNNQYTVTQPSNLVYDSSTVQTAVSFFQTAVVQTELPTQPPADVMGISAPADTITAKMADGSQHVLKIGSATPTGEGYYVQVDSNPAFTVAKSDVDNLLALFTAGKPPATPTAAGTGTAVPVSPTAAPTS